MQVQLVALAYVLFGGLLGYLFSRSLFREKELDRFFFVWVVVTAAVFTVSDPFLFFGVAGFVLFTARPRNPEDIIPYYILSLHMVPSSVGVALPFPGLNYLIFVDFAKLSAVAILLPFWFGAKSRQRKGIANRNLDLVIIAYFILISTLSYRSLSVTSVVRNFVDNAMLILVPYFAIKGSISGIADIQKIIRYWIMACLILAFVALISEYKLWNFYEAIPDGLIRVRPDFSRAPSIRGGLLRVGATIGPTTLAFALSVGVIFAQYVKQHLGRKKLSLGITQIIFLSAVYFTGGRGGWLSLFVMVPLYLLFFSRGASTRFLIKPAIAIILFLLVFSVGMTGFLALDEFGTFQYRYDLILNAWEVIKQNLLLGSVSYLETEALQDSRQGQGIIDIVNTYLQVALRFGLVGTALFVFMFVLPVVNLWNLGKRLDAARLEEERNLCNLMIVVFAGFAALLGTISWVSVVPQYTFLFAGIAAGVVGFAGTALVKSRQQEGLARDAGTGVN